MTGNAPDGGPVIMAIAGPNGAGKTTFFHSQLREAGLRFVNADDIASELNISPYEAAALAEALRCELVRQRESFIFETVFSDPVGAKLGFLSDAAAAGYRVVLCFIGISGVEASEERVAMRVSQGGHDVPSEKLVSNSDLAVPFRKVAEFRGGKTILLATPIPVWLAALV
jgi:predicted ABC-type ATPase